MNYFELNLILCAHLQSLENYIYLNNTIKRKVQMILKLK